MQELQQLCPNIESVPAPPVASLRINFSWTMAGNLVYGATQWGILVALARMGTPESVGQFSIGLAITAPIVMFSGLQLRAVQATDARGLFEFADYAGLRLCMTAAAVVAILAVAFFGYRGQVAFTIAAFALTKGIESLSDVIYGLWQQRERMDLIAKSMLLRGVLALGAAALAFHLFHKVWFSVCGIAVAWAFVFVLFDLRNAAPMTAGLGQSVRPRFRIPVAWRLAWLSLPLGIVTMLLSFNGNIPRYLIEQMRGVRELGIFSAPAYVLLAGGMVVNALGQSATPRLATYFSHGRLREFHKLSNQLILIGMVLGVGGVLAAALVGRQVLTLVYGSEYAQNAGLLVWLMIAAACGYMASFAGYSLTAARHFRAQMPLFAGTTILTFGLCRLMVKTNGTTGAAQALALVAVIQLVATMGIMRYLEMCETGETQ